jgi:predicted RNA-binding Zn-ribbon protein involved in translation (DUF1610 family)
MPFRSIANDFILLKCPHCGRLVKFTVLRLRGSATHKCPACGRAINFYPQRLRALLRELEAESQAQARTRRWL